MIGSAHVEADAIPRHIDALAIKMGEDKEFMGKKGHKPGSFDYQIKIQGDKSNL